MKGPQTVLVTGPESAGVTSLTECLRHRMPHLVFVDRGVPADAPAAVVFVASAVAPITESDCALAELAAASTDVMVAVLAKTDDHRDWRAVLAASRDRLAAHAARFESVPWVGAAAAPRLGAPRVDDVVDAVARALADPGAPRRNTLRRWEAGVCAAIAAVRAVAAEVERRERVAAARDHRAAVLRNRRPGLSQRVATDRHAVQAARIESMFAARNRCSAMRTELLDAAVEASRGAVADVGRRVPRRCHEVIAEVDELMSARLSDLVAELGAELPPAPPVPALRIGTPPLRQRRLEARLTTVLGAGFGFGAGVVVARGVSGLVPGLTVVGPVVGAAAGLILTMWVVSARALLHERSALAQWIGEAAAAVRAVLDERIATRLLVVESVVAAARTAATAADEARLADRVAACDAELRDIARAAERAEALRRHCEPGLHRALTAVRHGLQDATTARTLVTDR